jgi:hypothetical protein
MYIQILWDFDLNNPDDTEAHDKFAEDNGIPIVVDLTEYFKDPTAVSSYQITDALSDEHGWLVYDWEVINACKTDNDNDMINQQPQPINPEEDHMDNSTQNNEVTMSSNDLIVQLFNTFTQDGGSPKVTEFKRHLDNLIKSDIKPLCGRSAKSADGNDWRSLLKAKFSGRGAKWVKISIDNIEETLNKFDEDNISTESYRNFINQAGYAWIRFSGPRVDNGAQAAAFEVRVNGATDDHPKQLHYIPTADLDNVIEALDGTPHSKKLEVIANSEAKETETEVNQTTEEVATKAEETLTLEDLADDFNDFESEDIDDDIFANS